MVRPRKMPDPAMHRGIGVARPLGAELPDAPVVAVFGVEVFDELVEGVAVGAGGLGGRGAGGGDYCVFVLVVWGE